MTNKYIEIEMRPTAYGVGGSLSAEASFALDNFKAPLYNIGVKIDTGCSISTIPIKRLKVSDALCKKLKEMDIRNHTPYCLSYGVESGGTKHAVPITNAEKMNCPAMKFEHRISDLLIDGVKIPHDRIYLNYDRSSNVLIGMDILKNWDIHMGVSKVTGKNLFLACPLELECVEYLHALKYHFGISKKIS